MVLLGSRVLVASTLPFGGNLDGRCGSKNGVGFAICRERQCVLFELQVSEVALDFGRTLFALPPKQIRHDVRDGVECGAALLEPERRNQFGLCLLGDMLPSEVRGIEDRDVHDVPGGPSKQSPAQHKPTCGTQAVEAGVAALPIVSLVAFLIGVILAFQSAIGLKQFGGETFVANLVSLSVFRELGPLMTAILLAGRSSAAFAAEIGTMTVNNEVDALVTGGIDPIRFLVLPRLLAGLLVAPILSLFSDLIGVFAASLTMLAYQIPFVTFYEAVLKTIHVNDVMSGLTKSLLFGLIIAGVGCLRGMQTGTGAAAVGLSATRAVVSSLILIVMVDGVFAYISYKTGF